MKKLLYFADGNGANGLGEAYVAEAENLMSIVPDTTTVTAIYFKTAQGTRDKITFTHDNTTTTTGHRCKEIAKALAVAANAGPNVDGMTDIVDLDNNIYYPGLSFISAMSITIGFTNGDEVS